MKVARAPEARCGQSRFSDPPHLQLSKPKQHSDSETHPDPSQQLAALAANKTPAAAVRQHCEARINSLQKLALLAPDPCRKDLEALISSLQQQLERATAQAGTFKQPASCAAVNLSWPVRSI
jgi:hypothetical protein